MMAVLKDPLTTLDGMKAFLSNLDALAASKSQQVLTSMEMFLFRFGEMRQVSNPTTEATVRPHASFEATVAFMSELQLLMERGIEREERLDIWRVARIGRNEGRNAAVLAWAIDPRETHGFGTTVLDELVAVLRLAWNFRHGQDVDPAVFPFSERDADTRVRLEVNPFAQIESRVDIAVEGRDYAVYIELKVDAREHAKGDGQLATYLALAQKRAQASGRSRHGVVFIAPKVPRTISAAGPHVLVATWGDVAKAIRNAVSRRPPSLSASLLSQFADHAAKL